MNSKKSSESILKKKKVKDDKQYQVLETKVLETKVSEMKKNIKSKGVSPKEKIELCNQLLNL